MPRRLGFLCAALAMFFIAGGHWTVLQTVAWAEMLHGYSQRASIVAAVEQTFDGQHPCDLCRVIAAGKAKEGRDHPTTSALKENARLTAALAEPILAPESRVAVARVFPAAVTLALASRSDTPPTPPPRRGMIAA